MKTNTIQLGDNLEIMRGMDSGVVDLIYADPPFNTGRAQHGHTMSFHQSHDNSYDDSSGYTRCNHRQLLDDWHTRNRNSKWYFLHHICSPSELYYLEKMMPVIYELHRLLKQTGALYWHCDYRTSHLFKIIMRPIFGDMNCFLNEVVWHYPDKSPVPGTVYRFTNNYNVILVYANVGKNQQPLHRPQFTDNTIKDRGTVWTIARSYKSSERVGYPTQKPLRLLERIIRASSNRGDIVLDPFCGSGTTLVAADRLQRKWIGIDQNQEAVDISRKRIHDDMQLFYGHDSQDS